MDDSSPERELTISSLAEMLNQSEEWGRTHPDLDGVELHDELVAEYFGLRPNQRSSASALHMVAKRRGLRYGELDYSAEEDRLASSFAVESALASLGTVLKPKDPASLAVILLWGAHTHVIERFTSTFYLAFQGSTGAGKGTGVETCILLTPNGKVLSEGSDAYLSTVLNEGRAVGIEEWDILARKNNGVEGLLRNGYRRGVTRGLMVPGPGGKGWEIAERSLFGPKVYDTHTSPSGHLLGRSILIRMEVDNSVDRALDGELKAQVLSSLRSALTALARQALAEWSQARVDDLWRSPEFRARVKRLGGRTGRDHVIAGSLLLTCDLYGWDLEEQLRAIIAGRPKFDEYGVETEVIEVIRDLTGVPAPGSEVPVSEVLAEVNRRRQERGESYRLNSRGLAAALQDLGFRRPEEWDRAWSGTHRGAKIVRPCRILGEWSDRDPSRTDGTQARPGGPDLERAVQELGPTVQYPDGTVTDRRTGAVLRGPA